jgi:hypothetical protein
VIHLTTAKMNLLEIKQKSEQSQTSSFEHKLSGGGWNNMACEDLLNIDESMKIHKGNVKQKPFQEKHHSMPVQFVGNRFNQSSLTEIYIPSCRGNGEGNTRNQLATPCNSFDEEKSTHSSSVEVPQRREMTIDAPDQLTAEILYNLSGLSRDASPFKTHSINSDKRMSIDKGNTPAPAQPFPETSHENDDEFANKRFDSKFMPPATIYSSDSDSGMAGSYTLSPSDQNCAYRSFISHKFNKPRYFVPNTISDPNGTLNQEGLADLRSQMARFLPQESSIEGENRSKVVINFESGVKTSPSTEKVYFSGMYAHWWKKEKLPLEMVEAIARPVSDGESEKRERGSGKQNPLKIHLMMLHFRVLMQLFLP